MLDDQNEGAAAQADYADLFEADGVTATVNPAPPLAPANVNTGFGALDATLEPAQPAAPTVNTRADKGEDADVDLDARVAELLPDKSTSDWNAVTAFMAHVVPWPASPQDAGYINLVNGYVTRKVPDRPEGPPPSTL